MKIFYFLFALLLAKPVFAQNSNFEYVAFILCGGNPRIPIANCMIDTADRSNQSYLELTNFGLPNAYSFKTISQAGQYAQSGLGMRLSKNFIFSMKNLSRQQTLSVTIFRKDDQVNPVMRQEAGYGQTISLRK